MISTKTSSSTTPFYAPGSPLLTTKSKITNDMPIVNPHASDSHTTETGYFYISSSIMRPKMTPKTMLLGIKIAMPNMNT